MRPTPALLLVTCCACASAQDLTSSGTPPTIVGPTELLRPDGTVDGWPDLAATVSPNITIEGITWIRAHVSASGELMGAEVARGFSEVISESAIRTVQELEFAPATENGEPVAGEVLVRVRYQLHRRGRQNPQLPADGSL